MKRANISLMEFWSNVSKRCIAGWKNDATVSHTSLSFLVHSLLSRLFIALDTYGEEEYREWSFFRNVFLKLSASSFGISPNSKIKPDGPAWYTALFPSLCWLRVAWKRYCKQKQHQDRWRNVVNYHSWKGEWDQGLRRSFKSLARLPLSTWTRESTR